MAKVIGFDKSAVTLYKKTCKKCGAIIIFEEDDVETEYSGQREEHRTDFGICPNCSSKVAIDLENDKYVEETPENQFSGWPNSTNCPKDCKRCYARCLYRKEPTMNNISDGKLY